MSPHPHVLISNDDGVNAPGLHALVTILAACDDIAVSICGPAEEQSAKSHALSLHKVVVATRIPKIHPAVVDSYAVSGTPSDSVMLALSSSILSRPAIDLVVSGINRGENCGLHIVYSGTVGAAREAAINGVPAIAVSLDNYSARAPEQYLEAAKASLPVIKAMLGKLSPVREVAFDTRGYVLNLNVGEVFRGYAWARQGTSCAFSRFAEQPRGTSMQPTETNNAEQLNEMLQEPGSVYIREFVRELDFRNDADEGTDLAMVKQGYMSCTPLKILQHVGEATPADAAAVAAYAVLLRAAAKEGEVEVKGLPVV